jgi:hypothetical protein
VILHRRRGRQKHAVDRGILHADGVPDNFRYTA